MAQVDYFLKVDGVEGESTDAKHRNEIDILSYSWGVTQTGSQSAGSGGGAGKVAFQDFHFVANSSKASPKLFLACASGQHIKSAILTVRKAGKDQQEFIKYTLEDILVTEFNNDGPDGDLAVPTDQFSINFVKIEFSIRSQNPDGTLGDETQAGWDVGRNVKI
jgi:type VI secretion system secreted protein Hcp